MENAIFQTNMSLPTEKPSKAPIMLTNYYEDEKKLSVRTLQEVYQTNYPPTHFIVDGLLPAGLGLLVGAPKTGKSFLAYSWCFNVCNGLPVLGNSSAPCDVLYCAFEDTYQRLKSRACKMFGQQEMPNNLFLATTPHTIDEGFISILDGFYQEHPNVRFVVVDTLQKIRGASKKNNDVYSSDYAFMNQLKQWADLHQVCLLLVHHTRKLAALSGDNFETVSGSTGLLGCADFGLLFQRSDRLSEYATLEVTGRDISTKVYHLVQDTETLLWAEKDAPPTPRNGVHYILTAIHQFISKDRSPWSGSATELIAELKLDIAPNALSRMLNDNTAELYALYGIQHKNHRRTITLCRQMKGGDDNVI